MLKARRRQLTMKCGDNINHCHDLKDLLNMSDHLLVYCTQCKQRFHVKPQDKKTYNKIFRKESLQPGGHNLYYKYYGKMNVLQ